MEWIWIIVIAWVAIGIVAGGVVWHREQHELWLTAFIAIVVTGVIMGPFNLIPALRLLKAEYHPENDLIDYPWKKK